VLHSSRVGAIHFRQFQSIRVDSPSCAIIFNKVLPRFVIRRRSRAKLSSAASFCVHSSSTFPTISISRLLIFPSASLSLLSPDSARRRLLASLSARLFHLLPASAKGKQSPGRVRGSNYELFIHFRDVFVFLHGSFILLCCFRVADDENIHRCICLPLSRHHRRCRWTRRSPQLVASDSFPIHNFPPRRRKFHY
jgi:hypothetical protein